MGRKVANPPSPVCVYKKKSFMGLRSSPSIPSPFYPIGGEYRRPEYEGRILLELCHEFLMELDNPAYPLRPGSQEGSSEMEGAFFLAKA